MQTAAKNIELREERTSVNYATKQVFVSVLRARLLKKLSFDLYLHVWNLISLADSFATQVSPPVEGQEF